MSGSRDRSIMTWKIDQGLLKTRQEAHSRTLTSVRIYQGYVFSSSRDRSVKIWDLLSLESLQILSGTHKHSVWGIDVRNDQLITSSADKSLNVWRKDLNTNLWNFKFKLDNNESLRHVIILKKAPHLALSGKPLCLLF